MRAIVIRTTGAVEEQQWDQQTFHRWRLGEIDGVRRRAVSLDFGLDIWAAADQGTQRGSNTLGAEVAQRLALPEERRHFRPPYAADMLVLGAERTGLGHAQCEFVLGQVEDIFSPLVPEGEKSGVAA